MIICPNCQHEEMVGSLFCNECGTQLVFPDGIATAAIMPSAGISLIQ